MHPCFEPLYYEVMASGSLREGSHLITIISYHLILASVRPTVATTDYISTVIMISPEAGTLLVKDSSAVSQCQVTRVSDNEPRLLTRD